MELRENSLFEIINRDVKIILAEFEELVAPKQELLECEQITKNNEDFMEMLDKMLENQSTIEELKK